LLLDACSGDFNNLTFDLVVKFALNGDLICRQAIEEVAVNLGVGIADLVNIFNPDLIVLGGAFIQGKDILQSIIEKTIFSNALQPSTDNLKIKFSERSAEACVLGAVAVVLDDILREMVIS
jgi:predicted NBD/HSP70 family sugar kinase